MDTKKRENDYVKASRRGSREAEIEMHGRPLGRTKVHKSKKAYSRKGGKAALIKLPFDLWSLQKYVYLRIIPRLEGNFIA